VDWLEIVLFVSTLLIMLFGLIGSALPVIPGVPIIWVAALIYGLVTGFETIGLNYLLIFGILTAVSLVLDWVVNIYGAKKFGASKWGMVGAFLGMIVGMFVGALAGMIIGPFIGAVLFELLIGKTSGPALKAGFGTFVGFIVGVVMKFGLAVAMIGFFVDAILFSG